MERLHVYSYNVTFNRRNRCLFVLRKIAKTVARASVPMMAGTLVSALPSTRDKIVQR